MSHSDRPPGGFSPDDALPPVEPPSAGFVVQLFVLPAVIVLLIIVVWLLFNWLAQREDDPKQYVQALARDNAARWQVANNLADALRNPSNDALRQNRELAANLVSVLKQDLERKTGDQTDVRFRIFLCRALGEFSVPEGAEILMQLAGPQTGDDQLVVRLSALDALTLLSSHIGEQTPEFRGQVRDVFFQAASDSDEQVRTSAAYGLGIDEDQSARDRLARMLDDASPIVRCNAANGLARHGDTRAVPVLIEMLDPKLNLPEPDDKDPNQAAGRVALVQLNALRAASQLVDHQPVVDPTPLDQQPVFDPTPLAEAAMQLQKAEVGGQVQLAAKEFLNHLRTRHEAHAESSAAATAE